MLRLPAEEYDYKVRRKNNKMRKKIKQNCINVYSLNGLGFELASIINREEKLLLTWAGAR